MNKKEHKIVVTRDDDSRSVIATWSHPHFGRRTIKRNEWLSSTGCLRLWLEEDAFKEHFGFIPDKGTKEVITITREKK